MTEDEAQDQAAETLSSTRLEELPAHARVRALGASATGHFFVRFGTAFLLTGNDKRKPTERWDAVATALREDSRVVEVSGERPSDGWSSYKPVYPSSSNPDRDALLSGRDAKRTLRFSTPLYFKLHVPLKNQPKVYDWTDLATEDYLVAWDGASIFVLWDCLPQDVHPPRLGGHIAFEVLNRAAVRAGMSLMVQACSRGCGNMFGHTEVRIVQLPKSAKRELYGREAKVAVAVLSVDGGPDEVLKKFVARLGATGYQFALMKNHAFRLRDIEQEARKLVSELLKNDYDRLQISAQGFARRAAHAVKSAPRVLGGQGHRRAAKHTIASLWLAMVRIETLKRDWELARLNFDDTAGKRNLSIFYTIDRKDDDNQVDAIKLDFIRAAAEQQSSRIDNHMVATVTAVGAVAALVGAVAGGAIGGM